MVESMALAIEPEAERLARLAVEKTGYGTACVAEQSVIADAPVARGLRHEMKLKGAYFCTSAEAARLAAVLFDGRGAPVVENVGQSAKRLASLAGFDVPPRTRVLVAEPAGIGPGDPLSAEKLAPVLAWYEVADAAAGVAAAESVVRFGGWGHTAVVHARDPETVAAYGRVPSGRILANTPAIAGGMGFSTGLARAAEAIRARVAESERFEGPAP